MFDKTHKSLALKFARTLAQRQYPDAYAMMSKTLQSNVSIDNLREDFERMIPLDWGAVDPIELEENDDWSFLYIVLGGNVYSEAIIIDSFILENGILKINKYEFGRP